MSKHYPANLPEYLKSEYDKYLADPKKYQKLHPVSFKLLNQYIGTNHVKKD